MSAYLIFANGEPNDGVMVQRALAARQRVHVVAVDGGARVARYFGCRIQTLIGDLDSLPAHEVQRLSDEGVQVLRFPPEKDETDLELALNWAAGQGAQWLRIIGGIGGRFDQMLANVYLLALPALIGRDVELVAGRQALRLLRPGEWPIHGQADDTISLIPLGGPAQGVRTQGLKYPLRDETLSFGPARGVSNVLLGAQGLLSLREGLLLLVHTVGRA